MRPNMPSFCAFYASRIFIFSFILCQVLCVDRTSNTADQRHETQWYEKRWKTSSPGSNTEAIYIDDGRWKSRIREGSGVGAGDGDDLDETASGYGEDDEDAERGSGDTVGSRVDISSGDIALPPTHPNEHEPDRTSISSFSSVSTTTTSARLSPLVTTVARTVPSSIGPFTTTHVELVDTISSRSFETTTIATSRTTPSVILTRSTTTTTDTPSTSRKRPTTTTTITTAITRPTQVTSPKMPPPMFDDTNKAMAENFWMRPGVLAGLIGGAVAGLLAAILLVMFVVYRMRKKDEGSYALEEPKPPPAYTYAYEKAPSREFYA